MPGGAVQVFTQSIASGVTLTGAYDLGTKPFKTIYLEVPTMTSGTDFYIQASADNTNPYRRVQYRGSNQLSFAVSIASGVTLTGGFDLGPGAASPMLLINTMATGTSVLIQGSPDNTTFQRVTIPLTASSTVATDWSVATFAANTSRLVPIPAGLRYFKIELATALTDTTSTWKVIATRYEESKDFIIASNISQRMVPIPASFRYYKVELSTAMTDTTSTFRLVCAD